MVGKKVVGGNENTARKTVKDGLDGTGDAIITRRLQQMRGTGYMVEEQAINQLQRLVDEAEKDEYALLIYDIETLKDSDCPNPSCLLWHFGFRLNKSCWVLPRKSFDCDVIKQLLAHWHEHNIEVHIVRQHPDEQQALRRKARIMLERRIMWTHESLITRLGNASDRLNEAQKKLQERIASGEDVSWQEQQSPERDRDNDIRVILRESTEAMMGALDCARLFDEEMNVKDLLNGLRKALLAETKAFNARMLMEGRKPAPLVPNVSVLPIQE